MIDFKRIPCQLGLWKHSENGAVLTTYVDDLLLVASESDTIKLWEAIEKMVSFKDPYGPIERYLGTHNHYEVDGESAILKTEMSEFMRSAVVRLELEIGSDLREYDSPHMVQVVYDEEEEDGVFKNSCASHLMKAFYAARMCRPDLHVAITRLAAFATKWEVSHDAALLKIFGYIKKYPDLVMTAVIDKAKLDDLHLRLWCDSDYNGDAVTTKSCSGMFIEIVTGQSSWPLSWYSKRQPLTASSSAEAELLSLSLGLRREGAPMQEAIATLLGKPVNLIVAEDNAAAISSIKSGYSVPLRRLSRSNRTCLGQLHENLLGQNPLDDIYGYFELHQVASKVQKADGLTKPMARIELEHCKDLWCLAPSLPRVGVDCLAISLPCVGVDSKRKPEQ